MSIQFIVISTIRDLLFAFGAGKVVWKKEETKPEEKNDEIKDTVLLFSLNITF